LSTSSNSNSASLAHSIPPAIPASRTASACRPSVKQRFTLVWVQDVIWQISRYEYPSALTEMSE
jgi:hypothetical protein